MPEVGEPYSGASLKTQEVIEVDPVDYSEEELAQRDLIMQRAQSALNQRRQAWDELDGMNYEQYVDENMKAANSFIPPKKNDEDINIVSGVTREKNDTLMSTILNLELAPTVIAFDEDEIENQRLGKYSEDLIRKSREIEEPAYDLTRYFILKNMLDQGDVHVEEVWLQYTIPKKTFRELPRDVTFKELGKWEKGKDELVARCESRLLNNLDVYPGNLRDYFIERQPYLITREEITREEARATYGKWERWKNAPKTIKRTTQQTAPSTYFDWTMLDTEMSKVEILKYQDKWSNTYQIMINGVMMLPVGFPLSFLMGVPEYTIKKGSALPIHEKFYYSKSVPAKMRVDQSLYDETLKMMVTMNRRSYKPPISNMTGFKVTSAIHTPGKVFKDIDADKIKPIGETGGVSSPQFAFMSFLSEQMNNKSTSPILEGQDAGRSVTAREIIERKQQAIVKLGVVILGVVNLEKGMAWNRLYNILTHWTEAIDTKIKFIRGEGGELIEQQENIFRDVGVESELEGEEAGFQILKFTDQEPPSEEQIFAREELLSEDRGTQIRIAYLNVDELRKFKNKFIIQVIPTEKTTNELRRALFLEDLNELVNIFGPQTLNVEHAKKRWATLAGEDPEKMFAQGPTPEEQRLQAQLAQSQAGQPGGGQANSQLRPQQQAKPSVNALLSA